MDTDRWSEWTLRWWDGRTSRFHQEGMRGAIVAVDQLIRRLAAADA